MRIIIKRWLLVLVGVSTAVLLAACSGPDEAEAPTGLSVVATTTVLGDIARQVVGVDGVVDVLLPIGVDPHDFQPSSAQVVKIFEADLVIANGLGLEGNLIDLLDSASDAGVRVVMVGDLVSPVVLDTRLPCDESSDDMCDPHVWFDPERDGVTARVIAAELFEFDGSLRWRERADRYVGELIDANEQIEQILSAIPKSGRLIIANHPFLGYFADQYDFDVIGSVNPGGTALSSPSSAWLADLVETIDETGAVAIFSETTDSTFLAETVAAEANHEVEIVILLSGSLGGQGSGSETLIDMLISNARLIAETFTRPG